ncbi:MAG TPA: hypothetical protein VKD71_02000 [Gemmataceae bacterium]|nr:hypothetical protein [Gemmataceae bacterium]
MKPWHIIGSLALAFASPAAAADEPGAANREAMKKVAFLAGKWAGEATVQTGKGAAKSIQQTEDIRFRLNGVVLLIEGTGIGKLPDSDKEGVVFNALATLSYDAEAKKFLMRAYTMDGNMVDPEVTVSESGVVWQFTPVKTKVQVRFTIAVTGDTWVETGETSIDGKTWNKYLDMKLKRVKE